MQPKTARLALGSCLAIWLAMGSLSCAASPKKKSADLKFSGALSDADHKLEENQDEIDLTGRAGRRMASLFAVAYPTEGGTSP